MLCVCTFCGCAFVSYFVWVLCGSLVQSQDSVLRAPFPGPQDSVPKLRSQPSPARIRFQDSGPKAPPSRLRSQGSSFKGPCKAPCPRLRAQGSVPEAPCPKLRAQGSVPKASQSPILEDPFSTFLLCVPPILQVSLDLQVRLSKRTHFLFLSPDTRAHKPHTHTHTPVVDSANGQCDTLFVPSNIQHQHRHQHQHQLPGFISASLLCVLLILQAS